ncbi:TRM11 family SAM-dependent methyltransferase [Dermabacteraceae bacterium CCM 9519]
MGQRWLLLRAPSSNRVYTAEAAAIGAREADLLGEAFTSRPLDAEPATVAGVEYLALTAPGESEADNRLRTALAYHSSAYALFAEESDGRLLPLALERRVNHPSDLISQLKYIGKTNEQFTQMMVNAAACASDNPSALLDGSLRLLDPVCGRGTTLNVALSLGLSPVGVDIDAKDAEAYRAFLTTWLRNHRYKHTAQAGRLSSNGKVHGQTFQAEFAQDKAAQKAGLSQHLTLHTCDTTLVGTLLPAGKTDVVVADLPYGVQHGARTDKLSRSPLELLRRALPGWRRALRKGGAMALAVNLKTTPHDELYAVCAEAGLKPRWPDRVGEMRHRVDNAIERDVALLVRDDYPAQTTN